MISSNYYCGVYMKGGAIGFLVRSGSLFYRWRRGSVLKRTALTLSAKKVCSVGGLSF